jgi:hypothetical protein
MEMSDKSRLPQIEDPSGPIFEQQQRPEPKKAEAKPPKPFEAKAGVAALWMALGCLLSVLIAGRAGNKANFTMQDSFGARLSEQSSRQQAMMLENRLDIQQALKRVPSPADLQSRVDLRKKADDARDKADALIQSSGAALAGQVIMMRAAVLFALGMGLAALSSLWHRRRLWLASLAFGGLGLLFFLGGLL